MRFGQRLFQNAPEPKMFLSISGDHNSGFLFSKDVYVKGIKRFLQTTWMPISKHVTRHSGRRNSLASTVQQV